MQIPAELRAKVEAVVIDQTLTDKERSSKLFPLLMEYKQMYPDADFDQLSNTWNLMMVDIVDKHNLRRH